MDNKCLFESYWLELLEQLFQFADALTFYYIFRSFKQLLEML